VLLAASFLCASCSPGARSGAGGEIPEVRPEALRAHMAFLADDLLEGRGTGTRGHELAARYVAAQLEALGLEPAGDSSSFLQRVPFRRAQLVEAECSLALRRGGTTRPLAYARDYFMGADPLRERSALAAPAVFAGFGVTAPELGHDDYADLDARGKVVVLLAGAPPGFPRDQRAYYSSNLMREANAVAHGAVGILTLRTTLEERRVTWERAIRQSRLAAMRWLEPDGTPHDAHPEILVTATLSRSGAEALFAGAPRPLAAVLAEADTGAVRGFALPVEVRARRTTRHSTATSPNVAGLLRGSDPRLRDQYVVFTAHLDHLGVSTPVDGDSINNGAYDNASGVATMLEVARALRALPRPPRRSVLFLAVTGEEKGLQGSGYFARFPTVPRAGIVADVNLDMFLMLHPLRAVVAVGAEHSSLGPVVERAARRLGLRVVPDPAPEEVVFVRSDQYSFVRQGVPAVFLVDAGEGPEENAAVERWLRTVYHTPADDMRQRFDWGAAVKFAQLNYLVGLGVADEAQRPSWKPGDFFGEKFGAAAASR
jgi:hypothetical protein